ncbi:hypothetical protein BH20ACT19_BH20ACT19_07400 [soil metagenome]
MSGISQSRGLRAALAPETGERVLEVGPGTGYCSLDVAEWIGPGGPLFARFERSP